MVVDPSGITNVAVIGFGTMGEGIVQSFAEAGFVVRAIDLEQAGLDRGVTQIRANLKAAQSHGILSDDPATILSRISTFTWDMFDAAVDGCQLVIESVPEQLALKQDVFKRLDSLPRDVLIGSNTSSMTVSQLTEGMESGARVVGMHYFNPAHLIPAVEIHKGANTDRSAIDAAIVVIEKAGKVPVLVRKEVPGFIINRLTGALEREIDFLLDEGVVTPEDLDAAVKASIGLRLACIGPMEAEDFIGLDTSERVSNTLYKVLSNSGDASPGLSEKVARGELGLKSGKGWYDYSDRSRAEVFLERDEKLMRQLDLFRAQK